MQLTSIKSKDNDAISKLTEREKIRQEVQAELHGQAQTFVSEQINQAHALMQVEFDRQLAMRVGDNCRSRG